MGRTRGLAPFSLSLFIEFSVTLSPSLIIGARYTRSFSTVRSEMRDIQAYGMLGQGVQSPRFLPRDYGEIGHDLDIFTDDPKLRMYSTDPTH